MGCTPPPFTFIDLFAGIGGFRIALEKLGGECRFSSEWDRYSRKTYETWFGEHSYLSTQAGEIIERESLDLLNRLKRAP